MFLCAKNCSLHSLHNLISQNNSALRNSFKMKLLLSMLLVVTYLNGKVATSDLISNTKEGQICIREFKLDEPKIRLLDKGLGIDSTEPQYVQFMECYGKKQGWLSENGEINIDLMAKRLYNVLDEIPKDAPQEETLKKIMTEYGVDKCRPYFPNTSGNDGTTIIEIINCFTGQMMKYLFGGV